MNHCDRVLKRWEHNIINKLYIPDGLSARTTQQSPSPQSFPAGVLSPSELDLGSCFFIRCLGMTLFPKQDTGERGDIRVVIGFLFDLVGVDGDEIRVFEAILWIFIHRSSQA